MTKGISMELREYIEAGEKIAGGRKELAAKLGLTQPNNLTDAKRGARGLPLVACYKLAELIDARPEAVAAASALVTEKDEGARDYLRPFVQAGKLIHHLTIAAVAAVPLAILTKANELAWLTS